MRKQRRSIALGVVAAACALLGAQITAPRGVAAQASQPEKGVGSILRLDPAANSIVPANAKIEKVADGFGFLEGPAWVRRGGYLLFSDIPANAIDRWMPSGAEGGKVSVFLAHSGFTRSDTSGIAKMNFGKGEVLMGGSNGIAIDRQGRVTFCQHGDRDIVRLEKDGKHTVLASRYEGKRLNSPNDLVYRSDGSLYFTDPPFALPKGDQDPQKEMPWDGVYRWSNGKLQLLTQQFKGPNGIAFSPDEKYLYIDDSTTKTYWRFEVKPDGTLANGKLFVDMSGSKEDGVPDGMKIDRQGNVYGAGPGGLWIMTPDGKHVATIAPPELPANMAWGDADGKTLYMTARTGLYRVRLNIVGVRP